MLFRIISASLLVIYFTFFFFCATIVSDSRYTYNVDSQPQGARVSVIVRGAEMTTFKTPGMTSVDMKQDYMLKFTLDGYETQTILLEKGLNYWFFGNILCGGLIGIVVDIVTGAMWRPENGNTNIQISMVPVKQPAPTTPNTKIDKPSYLVQMSMISMNGREVIARFVMRPGKEQGKMLYFADLIQEIR